MKLFRIFLFGSFSSFLMIFIYNWVFILLYVLSISTSLNILAYNITNVFATWIWLCVAMAVLYGFIIVLFHVMSLKRKLLHSFIINALFFIVTVLNILFLLGYIPSISPTFKESNIAIYIAILSFSFVSIALILSYTMKCATFKLFNFILSVNTYQESDDFDNQFKEYNAFLNIATEALFFGEKEEHAIGIIGIRISNHSDIIKKYGTDIYVKIKKEFTDFVKNLAEIKDNQYFLYSNTIYFIAYSNSEEALKCLIRYDILLKEYTFGNEGDAIPISISSAVSGLDFSKTTLRGPIEIVADNMMKSLNDLLIESKDRGNPIVSY